MGKTITQKIFAAHTRDTPTPDNVVLDIDVVMCHEITTPIAINDLVSRGLDKVFDPAKIKAVIDHVTPAKDSKTAMQGKILRDWAKRSDIKDFFDIGKNGVCHVVFPEKGFVRPGYTIIMGDSHTCTHGAFGAFDDEAAFGLGLQGPGVGESAPTGLEGRETGVVAGDGDGLFVDLKAFGLVDHCGDLDGLLVAVVPSAEGDAIAEVIEERAAAVGLFVKPARVFFGGGGFFFEELSRC